MVDGSHVEVGKFAFDESQERGRTGDCCRLQNPRQIVLEKFVFENNFDKSYDLPIFVESIGQFRGGVLDSGPVETLRTGVAFLKCRFEKKTDFLLKHTISVMIEVSLGFSICLTLRRSVSGSGISWTGSGSGSGAG